MQIWALEYYEEKYRQNMPEHAKYTHARTLVVLVVVVVGSQTPYLIYYHHHQPYWT